MSTESQQQIARQRSEHGVEYAKCEGCGDPIAGIIKTETGVTHEMCMKDAQPQRSEQESFRDAGYRGGKFKPEWRSEQRDSEQQEWRVIRKDENGLHELHINGAYTGYAQNAEFFEKLCNKHQERVDHLKGLIKTLADECLAEGKALTAERQRFKKDYDLITHKLITCGVIAEGDEHRNKIYKSGGKWDSQQAEKVRELRQQLLSALAAIEKKNAKLMELIQFHISGDPCHVLETVALQPDLSLLHEHDKQITDNVWAACEDYVKEVSKPLVDVINELLDTSKDVAIGVFPTEAHLQARRKAVGLAKVKQ